MKTNTVGSHNLLRALRGSRVTSAVFLSTDKAVYPLNAMGMTKALVEKLVRAEGNTRGTNSVITRYGNVIGSRGSVIPKFIDQIKRSNIVTVTNPEMTRFMMSLEESVDLVLFAMKNGQSGDLFVHKASAASVNTIVEALCKLLGRHNVKKTLIGSRPGEKIHETLLNVEERAIAIDHDRFFQVPILKEADGPGLSPKQSTSEFSSNNTRMLSSDELANFLLGIPIIKSLL